MRAILLMSLAAALALPVSAFDSASADRLPRDPSLQRAVQAGLDAIKKTPPSPRGVRAILSTPRRGPNGQLPYTGLEVTNVGAGYDVAGLPCFACVPDVDPYHIATPIPQASMPRFSPISYWVNIASDTYDGQCTVGYALVALPSLAILSSANVSATCSLATNNVIAWSGLVPDAPGDALVVGVVYGSRTIDRWFQYLRILP